VTKETDVTAPALETDTILYEVVDRVAVISLNRPQAANAQTPELLDDLNRAWEAAADDPEVRVIVLRANGKHFSAGHDLKGVSSGQPQKWTLAQIIEAEARRFLGYSLNWRNVPKPSIAAVQGVCIAGGLLLAWPCDLIIAADNAKFSDPVVAMGIGGVEYHGHTWELGARLAKEILFTGRALNADEAKAVGMVNRVVPLDDLQTATRELALEIASKHPWALRMAKRAVNQTLDIQGFTNAVQAVFDVHTLGHGHAMTECGYPVLVDLEAMKKEIASKEPAKA
jgi:enoyl-CoA hydratase/carnithine racemase